MKKLLAMLLAVVMLLALCVGCGQKPEPDPSKDADVSTGTSVDDNSEETPDDSTEDTDDTDTTDTTDTTEGTDDTTDTTEGTGDDTTTTTDDGKVTQSTTKSTTKTSGKTDKTEKTTKSTTKSSGKTDKTTKSTTKSSTKSSTTKSTTKSSTKSSTTKSTTVSTTKSTTTTVSTTKSTKFVPNFSTTSSSGGGLTTGSSGGQSGGYEFDPGDEWELYWRDEFDGNALDTTKWNYEVGKTNFYTEKEENVTVQNGKLVITARHANPKNNQGLNFTTGAINSSHKFSFQYGRLEFRARLPYGEGVFPALWTMGDYYLTTSDELGWPRCGEIDVMEFIGGGSDAEKYTDPANKISTFNLHWGANRDVHEQLGTTNAKIMDGIWADDYHIFAIEWDENSIKFFRDDRLVVERSINDPSMLDAFHQKHWIIINVALCDFEPDMANDTTPLPQSMFVDYVRVYKKK